MANNNPTVHTVPNGSEWKNVQDGKTIDLYETKGLAVEAGREKLKMMKQNTSFITAMEKSANQIATATIHFHLEDSILNNSN